MNEPEILEEESESDDESGSEDESESDDEKDMEEEYESENESEMENESESEDESEREDESGRREKDSTKGDYTEKKQKQNTPLPTASKYSWRERLAMKILKEAETKGSISQFLRTWALMLKGNLAPAGNFHLSFMFGPLIFESGLKR